jgi:aminoglycoside phosphotransferase family enzyme/predicted kinase
MAPSRNRLCFSRNNLEVSERGVTDSQADIIAFLSRPESYGLAEGPIERHATHGSQVFLAGECAYKLKRAVKLSYLDYSTRARRKAMCERELAVNQRLAPELYIEVVSIVRRENGAFALSDAKDDARAVDWLVVMRRFGQETLFRAMAERGALDRDLMRGLAERLGQFHGDAERQSSHGGAGGIEAVIDENRQLLAQEDIFARDKIEKLEAMARGALDALRAFLDDRRARGFVRRVHGDLHLNNICLFDGKPVPFDAIEFEDDFACIDVLFDLALLVMDLDRRGLRAEANALLNRYLECTGDYEGLRALPLFLSCRAAMRAHVTVAMAKSGKGSLSQQKADEARHLLDCALAYLAPAPAPAIAVGGVSGTGKSTLAAGLAPHLGRAPGAIVIRSDVMRKALWGVDALTRLPKVAYDKTQSARVYRALGERARLVLASGHAVIADAVFGRADERAAIARLARTNGAPFHGLWLDAPTGILESRLDRRRNDASDATAAVLHAQLGRVEAPDDWHHIDAGGTQAEAAAAALEVLAQDPGGVRRAPRGNRKRR